MDEGLRNFYEVLARRRSVREFLEKDIEEEKLRRLLDALRRAQSAANCQPWHFVLVKGKEKDALNPVFTKEGFKRAPVALVACADPIKAWVRKADARNYAWVDVSVAVTEMVCAATIEGIGSCWVASFDPEEVKRILGIPKQIEIVAIIALGYPAKELKTEEKDRKPIEEIIHHGGW